jgi:hypothetical protein
MRGYCADAPFIRPTSDEHQLELSIRACAKRRIPE